MDMMMGKREDKGVRWTEEKRINERREGEREERKLLVEVKRLLITFRTRNKDKEQTLTSHFTYKRPED